MKKLQKNRPSKSNLIGHVMVEDNLQIGENDLKRIKKRRILDYLSNFKVLCFTLFMVAIVIWIIVYVFQNGSSYLTWDYITGDYTIETTTLKTDTNFNIDDYKTFENQSNDKDIYFSSRWGIGLKDKLSGTNNSIYIAEIADGSPFESLVQSNNNSLYDIKLNSKISLIILQDVAEDGSITYNTFTSRNGASAMVEALDEAVSINSMNLQTEGGGIRGSLLNTLLLILFSLLFSFPFGVGCAIYFGEYAKDNAITRFLRTLIDVTSGIPSIIFGLAGAIIFIPFTAAATGSSGGNIFSGSLTMAIMLLPTIIKTTEESIKVIPKSLEQASLALGASKTETVFKIILPNSLPGILTSGLLSIGRIIGESAALVFAMGATIGDNPSFTNGYATLAVHIWVILQGETPAYGSACAISIIILLIFLVLTLCIKLISWKLNRYKA